MNLAIPLRRQEHEQYDDQQSFTQLGLQPQQDPFNKSILRGLGDPVYVQLLVNPESRLIAVRAVDRAKSGDQTYRMPTDTAVNSHSTEITSQSLMSLLADTFPELHTGTSCQLSGIIVPSEKIALFSTDKINHNPDGTDKDD